MQEYRIICKSDRGFVNAVLAASQEDTVLVEIKESKRELIIPEFEAYRTGIPEIRKILKPNEILLRCQYFNYSDYNYTKKEDINFMSTGTSGNLKKIDTAYQKGAYLDAYVPVKNGERVYLYNNFKIVFVGPDRIPTLRYKPTYISRPPIYLSIRELIDVYHGNTKHFGSEPAVLTDLKVMCRLLPKLIKYSP